MTDDKRDAWHSAQFDIPQYVERAYKAQRDSAKRRGLPFGFTLLQWCLWWRAELHKLGGDASRGNRAGQLMMCRHGDAGGYEPGNVYAGTPAQNMNEDKVRSARSIATTKRWAEHPESKPLLGRTGDRHPRSTAVLTPNGRYGSISLAAKAHGISRAGGLYRVRRGAWSYELPRGTLPVE